MLVDLRVQQADFLHVGTACSAADRTTVGGRVRLGKDHEAGDQGCPARARNLSSYDHAIPACVEEGRL